MKKNLETAAPTDKKRFQQAIDSTHSIIRLIDGFDPLEQDYPQFIDDEQIERVANLTMSDKKSVDSFVKSVNALREYHDWIAKRVERNLEVPTNFKEMKRAMLSDPDTLRKRKRQPGG